MLFSIRKILFLHYQNSYFWLIIFLFCHYLYPLFLNGHRVLQNIFYTFFQFCGRGTRPLKMEIWSQMLHWWCWTLFLKMTFRKYLPNSLCSVRQKATKNGSQWGTIAKHLWRWALGIAAEPHYNKGIFGPETSLQHTTSEKFCEKTHAYKT